MDLVSIIIINWNGKKFIEGCLNSIAKQDYPAIEIIVIDNTSTDGSPDIVEEMFPEAKLVRNKVNRGFAGAFNQGVDTAKGHYIMSLNPDVYLQPHFVSAMVNAIKLDERIGSVSGKLLRQAEDEEGVIDSTGHIIFKNRLTRNRGVDQKDEGQYDQECYIFGTCGAAALYKRKMLEDIKIDSEYCDEDFFAFWEDIDLDWRAQLRGWSCYYTPYALAHHFRGGIRKPRPKVIELGNYRNRYLAIIKNDSFLGLFLNLHHILFTDTIKIGALLLRCPGALLGWIDILKLLPKMLSKRRKIQKRAVVKPRKVEIEWFQKFDYPNWIKKNILS